MTDISLRTHLLNEDHMVGLKRYVGSLRSRLKKRIPSDQIFVPDFDPCDAGIHARCLFLLESPGPRTMTTGFVSRDNPDPTAENWSQLCQWAKLDRQETAMWNAYPWFLKNASFSAEDREIARREIPGLIKNFPDLQAVVFVGRRAEVFWNEFHQAGRHLALLRCPHPSNRHLNANLAAREEIVETLKTAKSLLKHLGSSVLTALTYTVESSNVRQSKGLKIQFASEGQEQATLSSRRPWRHEEPGDQVCLKLATELAAEIARCAGSLHLPLISKPESGFDGTSYSLELNSGMHQCHYSWWQDLPAPWQPLRPLIEKLDGLFEQYPSIALAKSPRP